MAHAEDVVTIYSRPPILLNGTVMIVLVAHFILISAFTYGSVSAGLARLAPDFEQVAESLGARPFYKLRRVTLPMIAPYLIAAFSLSFALSMGELGATVTVYPPGWVTLPVGIFALTDRGTIFDGAALTILLVLGTLAVLVLLSRLAERSVPR
jgi:2-aminoethylphosphonate transport system permease protein